MKKKGPVTLLKEELENKSKELKELKEKHLRTLAEWDNYRKRMEKELEDYRNYARVDFFMKIIPVLESFDRALQHDDTNQDFEKFYKGIEIIYRQLQSALASLGLVEFSGLGELFDPMRHEAVAIIEVNDKPENTVIEEISKGYLVGERVIKPAKVLVAKHKEKLKGGEEDGEDNRN